MKIADEWLGYCKKAVPDEAGDVQLTETRRAFYAGATAMFFGMIKITGENSEMMAEEILKGIDAELQSFALAVKEDKDKED